MAGLLANVPILGSLTGQNAPTNTEVPLNSQAQGMLDAGIAQGAAPTSTFTAAATQGMNQAAGAFAPNSQQNSQAAGQLGGDPSYTQALRNGYTSQANTNIENMKQQAGYQAEMQKANVLSQYQAATLGQQKMQEGFNKAVADYYASNQAARAQAITSLFGAAASSYSPKPTQSVSQEAGQYFN